MNRYMHCDFYPEFHVNFIIWKDGQIYEIQRVTDVRRAASLKAGGVGIRYTCIVNGRESHLFYEDNNMWFVEER